MPSSLREAIRYLREATETAADKLEKLKSLTDSMVDDPALNNLTARELRAFHGFRQTLNLCDRMTDDAIRKHVYSHWNGGEAHQAISKLPIYKAAKKAFEDLLGTETFDTNTVQDRQTKFSDMPKYTSSK